MLIDSHVNLHHHAFDPDRGAVIDAARRAGVGRMITICDRLENIDAIATIAAAHDDISMSVGVHPHYAKDAQSMSVETLVGLAASPKVCAIGETGLDRHYNHSPFDDQLRSFEIHLHAAAITGLPVIVHTRDADADTQAALTRAKAQHPHLAILMHCYTSGMALAQASWALGAYISFSGIMTFKSAEEVRAVARNAPLDRVLLETDCPYLAPVPHRGRRNEPALVDAVYDAFAALRGLSRSALEQIVRDNFFRLFKRISP